MFGFVFFAACKKELITPNNDTVVFYVDAIIDGNTLNYNAGDDGYYMFPSFVDDTLGIRSFVGRVGKFDCYENPDCPNSLEVVFREGELDQGNHTGIENSIVLGEYAARGPASFLFESYKAIFNSRSIPNNLNHEWFFGDGSNSYELNPVHYYLDPIDTLVHPLLQVSSDLGNCNSSISYDVNLIAQCQTDILVTKTGVLYWFSAVPSGNVDLWDFGSGYLPLGTLNPLPTGSVYKVCLQSTNISTGCIATKCENVVIDTSGTNCVANFDVEVEKVLLKDVRDFSEVTLSWHNENGKKYQSDLFKQPETSTFTVLNIEDYKDAELDSGIATKKVTFSFTMRLFGDNEMDFVDMQSDTSIIAVGYPKI